MIAERVYTKPTILSHQPIRFETAQSWNPGKGKHDHPGTGNGGIHFPPSNPNPVPCGAGTPGQGNDKGKGNGGGNIGVGQCNPNTIQIRSLVLMERWNNRIMNYEFYYFPFHQLFLSYRRSIINAFSN